MTLVLPRNPPAVAFAQALPPGHPQSFGDGSREPLKFGAPQLAESVPASCVRCAIAAGRARALGALSAISSHVSSDCKFFPHSMCGPCPACALLVCPPACARKSQTIDERSLGLQLFAAVNGVSVPLAAGGDRSEATSLAAMVGLPADALIKAWTVSMGLRIPNVSRRLCHLTGCFTEVVSADGSVAWSSCGLGTVGALTVADVIKQRSVALLPSNLSNVPSLIVFRAVAADGGDLPPPPPDNAALVAELLMSQAAVAAARALLDAQAAQLSEHEQNSLALIQRVEALSAALTASQQGRSLPHSGPPAFGSGGSRGTLNVAGAVSLCKHSFSLCHALACTDAAINPTTSTVQIPVFPFSGMTGKLGLPVNLNTYHTHGLLHEPSDDDLLSALCANELLMLAHLDTYGARGLLPINGAMPKAQQIFDVFCSIRDVVRQLESSMASFCPVAPHSLLDIAAEADVYWGFRITQAIRTWKLENSSSQHMLNAATSRLAPVPATKSSPAQWQREAPPSVAVATGEKAAAAATAKKRLRPRKPKVCRNFNNGHCLGAVCAFGRVHVCDVCGGAHARSNTPACASALLVLPASAASGP